MLGSCSCVLLAFMCAGFSASLEAGIAPPSLSLALAGYLKIEIMGDKLKFYAKALLNLPNPTIGLELGMEGTWCGAFGIKPLCIGDILGRVEVMTVIPWLSAIAVGGTIQLGNPKYGQNDPITGKVYVRVDIGNPQTNYFYGDLNKFTIGQFLNIIAGLKVDALPSIVAQTGFDKGVLFSYALGPVLLPSGDTIPTGFHFRGACARYRSHTRTHVHNPECVCAGVDVKSGCIALVLIFLQIVCVCVCVCCLCVVRDWQVA
jgi:hypothetical protein